VIIPNPILAPSGFFKTVFL